MSLSTTPGIDIGAVERVMRSVLPQLKALRKRNELDEDEEAKLIYANQKLGAAFYRSEYTRSHIGWEHALDLIYAVLNAGDLDDARAFATRLDAALKQTAVHLDYIAVIPLGFFQPIAFASKRQSVFRPFQVGPFTLVPAAATSAALNKRIKMFDSKAVPDDLFEHQQRQTDQALSSSPLLLLPTHGSSDSLRHQTRAAARRVIGLIELLGRVFGVKKPVLGKEATPSYLFLINKRTGWLDRVMAMRPLTVSISLERELLQVMKRPEVPIALKLLSLGEEKTLNAQLRNALEFFGRAVSEKDSVARFIFFVISMEAIFSRDKHAPIKITLADYASLLCFKGEDRRRVHVDLGKIYDARSEIVHTGVTSVKRTLLIKAEALAARALYCSLMLAIHLDDGQGDLQNKFFDLLKGMKIGVELNPIKLPAWQGYGPDAGE
jgi:hypothetical protein